MWHGGLTYRLKRLVICGKFHSFQSDRNQKVALKGQSSNCSHIEVDVPQGSVLGEVVKLSIYWCSN